MDDRRQVNRIVSGPTSAPMSALATCLLLGFVPAAMAAEDRPAATPYRPSVSSPAELSAPGWLEVETGLARVRPGPGARADALSYSLKLAFSPDWGIRIGGDAAIRARDAGERVSGGGDTAIIVKRRFEIDERSAFGLEAGVSLPTARRVLGSGSTDLLVNGIYSTDVGADWHADLNVFATRYGASETGLGRTQSGWAAGLSYAVDERLGLGVELSGTRRSGDGSTRLLLISASYATSKSVVWDIGVGRGLNSATPDWSLLAGVTFVALKLF